MGGPLSEEEEKARIAAMTRDWADEIRALSP
jgi:hypothetical protein